MPFRKMSKQINMTESVLTEVDFPLIGGQGEKGSKTVEHTSESL